MRARRFTAIGAVAAAVACISCSEATTAPPELETLPAQVVATAYNYAGSSSTCALTIDGEAYCWGWNGSGQLGDGSQENSYVPVKVETSLRFKTITVGRTFACATTFEDVAYCWGSPPSGSTGSSAEDLPRPAPVATTLRFTQLSAADGYMCGISTDADLYCWGFPTYADLGDGVTRKSATPVLVPLERRVVSVSAAWDLICALDDSGRAYCWGVAFPTDFGRPVSEGAAPFAEGFRFKAVQSNGSDVCGITTSEALYCWIGSDGAAPQEAPTTFLGNGHVGLSSGHPFCAMHPGGQATCWTVPVDYRFSFDRSEPELSIRELTSLSFLSIGGSNRWACGVVQTGPEGAGVYCWGLNWAGQLGIGSTVPSPEPSRTAMPRR